MRSLASAPSEEVGIVAQEQHGAEIDAALAKAGAEIGAERAKQLRRRRTCARKSDADRRCSVALGLLAPDAALSHEQLCALIFAPKLSTAHDVTDVSGRGEGMAAVAEAVASCAGKIAVRSKPGAGTTIEVRLPKLSVVDAAA